MDPLELSICVSAAASDDHDDDEVSLPLGTAASPTMQPLHEKGECQKEHIVVDCDHIKVAIRLRPLGPEELVPSKRSRWAGSDVRAWSLVQESASSSLANTTATTGILLQKGATCLTPGKTVFSFDAVFDEDAHTHHVYQDVARPIVHAVASGRHGTIFSYGQTGSGKTFTMQGVVQNTDNSSRPSDSADFGIIQMAAVDLFQTISSSAGQREYVVKAQYFEIYNEQIRDLLVTTTNASSKQTSGGSPRERDTPVELPVLSAREDPITRSVYVNAYEKEVSGVEDVVRLLQQGNRNRACAATNLNALSSRSHAIFRLLLESRGQGAMRSSVLNMVDLAGSENSKQAGVSGARKREGGKINQSLLSLSRVIHALSLPPKKRPKHISYRDAKLTRILQSHLSGNACMAVLCCVSAARMQMEETRSTLKFAASAKRIQMKATVNEIVDQQSLLSKLQLELAEVKKALQRLQSRQHGEDDSNGSAIPSKELFSYLKQESLHTQTTFATDLSGSSESKQNPPVSEVMVSLENEDDASTIRIDETEKRSKVLEDKLEATDELVTNLVKELENARMRFSELEQNRLDRLGISHGKDETEDKDGAQKMQQQHILLKYGLVLSLLFHFMGQTDIFIVTSFFLLLTLVASGSATAVQSE